MKKKKKKYLGYITPLVIWALLIGGIVIGASAMFPYQGGTGTDSVPTISQTLAGTPIGTYEPTSIFAVVTPSNSVGINDIGADALLEVASPTDSAIAYFMISTVATEDGDVLTVDTNGDVGINDTTPDFKLEILDTATAQLALTYTDDSLYSTFYTNSSGDLAIHASGGDVGIGDTTPDAVLEVTTSGDSSTTYFMISAGLEGDGDIFIVDSSGNIGIGDTTPDGVLDVLLDQNLTEDSAVCITADNVFSDEGDGTCDASSIRVKTDIRRLTYGLKEVLQLRPVFFRYKESFKPEFQLNRAGFIAEEMHELIPEVTTYDRDGLPDGIDYKRITAITVSAIQELDKMIENIEVGDPSGLISDLEDRIEALEKRVTELETKTVEQSWWDKLVDYFSK